MRNRKAHTGAMIAFMLSDDQAARIAASVADTLPVTLNDDLHVTVAFLGKASELSGQRSEIEAVLTAFTADQPVIQGDINGVGRFNPSDGSDGKSPVYANFDAPALNGFREALIEALRAAGVTPVLNHGFTPHVTLAYLPADAPSPNIRLPTIDVRFDRLTLAWGDERTDYLLTGTEEEPSMSKQTAPPAGGESQNKGLRLFEQSDVAYVPVSTQPGKMCAGCRWFNTYGGEYSKHPQCHIVQDWPEAIEPTGWCNRWEASPRFPTEQEPLPVVIVEPTDMGIDERAISDDPGVLKKALNAVLSLVGLGSGPGLEVGLKVYGNEWFGVWSNNFEDRENELFDHTAQDAYIKAVNAGELPMPKLKYWHIDHSTHGVATHIGRAGHFMWAKGVFTDDELGRAFSELYRKSKTPWRMSHGFAYPRRMLVNGVYKSFVTDEITTLPPMAAANFETWFIGGEKLVEVTKEQREALVAAVGDKGNQIADMLNNRGQQLRDAGVQFKGMHPLEDAEARKGIETLTDGQKTLAEAMAQMAESLKTMNDGVKANDDRFKAVESDIQEIKGLLKMAPRATQNPATVVGDTDPHLSLLKEKNRLNGKKSIVEQIVEGETPVPAASQPAGE